MALFKKMSFDIPIDPDVEYGLGDGLTWISMMVTRPDTSIAVVYANDDIHRSLAPAEHDPEFYAGNSVWDYVPEKLHAFPDKGVYHERNYVYFENNSCIYFYKPEDLPTPDDDEEGSAFHAIWWVGFQEKFSTRMQRDKIITKLKSRSQYPDLELKT